MPRRALGSLFALALIAAACGSPPSKELHQAQGAIDAARAAGADEYARDDYEAAVAALARAEQAVAQRDYRLALSQALDSREFAQSAAKLAASQKAQVRSEAERMLAQVTSIVAVASERLAAAQAARVPRATLDPLSGAIASARTALDEAGKALASEDYLEARRRLEGVAVALNAALQALPAASPARPARPVRRRR
jgi:hypothetical protein